MQKQKSAYIYALLAIFCWSTVATAFKIALEYMDFLQMLLFSCLIAILVLFIILWIQKKIKPVFKFTLRQYLLSAILGLLNPFLYYVILFKAYDILPAQIAQPLNYTWPVMLVILSIPFLKHKITGKSILCILISFAGVIIISFQGNNFIPRVVNPGGVALATGSSVIWALFWIFNIKDKRDEVSKLFLNFLFAFVYILILVLIYSEIRIPSPEGVAAVVYIGMFEMGVTFVLWMKALQLTKTSDKISQLVFISPFLSLVFIHFILGETLFYSTFAGLILIVGGVFLQRIKLTGQNKEIS